MREGGKREGGVREGGKREERGMVVREEREGGVRGTQLTSSWPPFDGCLCRRMNYKLLGSGVIGCRGFQPPKIRPYKVT